MWKNILIIFSVTFTLIKGVIYSNYKSTFYVPLPAHPVFTLMPATSIRLDSTTSVWKGGVHDDFQKWQNHHWTVSKWPIRNFFFLTAIKSECLNQQFCFTLPFPALHPHLLPFLSPKGNILAWQPVQISEPFHLNAPQRSCLITAWISERKKERKKNQEFGHRRCHSPPPPILPFSPSLSPRKKQRAKPHPYSKDTPRFRVISAALLSSNAAAVLLSGQRNQGTTKDPKEGTTAAWESQQPSIVVPFCWANSSNCSLPSPILSLVHCLCPCISFCKEGCSLGL